MMVMKDLMKNISERILCMYIVQWHIECCIYTQKIILRIAARHIHLFRENFYSTNILMREFYTFLNL